MLIIKPHIFKQFPEIVLGFSTKIGLDRAGPYHFNMSYDVGDDKARVDQNRRIFFKSLGLDFSGVAFQKQVHNNHINVVSEGGFVGESDAMITSNKNVGLAISSADCCTIFIYDEKNKVIAGVHSGWRGTQKEIPLKVLRKLSNDFDSNPGDLVCYIGPSIRVMNYEVGEEVAEQFDTNYLIHKDNRLYLDIPKLIHDVLINFGVFENKIQMSGLCSFEYKSLLHSYRREGENSGRALGIIAMKEVK